MSPDQVTGLGGNYKSQILLGAEVWMNVFQKSTQPRARLQYVPLL